MDRKRHFHSFDALRFLAFFKVFIFHLPISGFAIFDDLKAGGGIGVMFFFVLSGVLISYIMLEEKERTGKLNLKNFFIRRILRIWPMYYLMMVFAFCTPFLLDVLGLGSSPIGYEPNWWYTLSFLENYRIIFLDEMPNVSPLGVMWSVCIEEHFYLVWGIIFYFFEKKHIPLLSVISLLIALASRYYFQLHNWNSLDLLTNLDLFAIGALLAYLYMGKKEITLDSIRKRRPLFVSFFLLAMLLFVFVYPHLKADWLFIFGPTLLGLFFGGLLLLFIVNPSLLRIGERNFLSRWGKYTYGLYMYHTIVIGVWIQLWARWELGIEGHIGAFFFGLACFGASLGISILSYRLFELPFLRLKKYF